MNNSDLIFTGAEHHLPLTSVQVVVNSTNESQLFLLRGLNKDLEAQSKSTEINQGPSISFIWGWVVSKVPDFEHQCSKVVAIKRSNLWETLAPATWMLGTFVEQQPLYFTPFPLVA